jgi:hypothetical protein
MLQFYHQYLTTYRNGELMQRVHSLILIEEEKESSHNYSFNLTWDNLDNFYHDFGFHLPFNIWNFDKGRVISFFNSSLFDSNTWDIKEWKTKDLNIVIKFSTKKATVSLAEILKWHDSDKAIQYLKERGLDKKQLI